MLLEVKRRAKQSPAMDFLPSHHPTSIQYTHHTLLTTMDKMTTFTLLGPAAAPVMAPRLGRLSITGRKAISTPHYIPLTTRGTVSHIAHDVMRDHTAISSLYIGLEDCMLFACLWGAKGDMY